MDSGEETTQNSLRMIEPNDGVFATYSNLINLDWTLYDFRLRFAELVQLTPDEGGSWKDQQLAILEKATISIPFHLAKSLRNMLDNLIASYESVNGELKPIQIAPTSPKVAEASDQE